MSTTSTIITIIICVILVAAIGFALVKGIWSAAKKITVPIQVALFVVMLVCVCRLFCTKENAKKLYDGIEKTGISQNVENTMRTALKLKSAEAIKPEDGLASESVADRPKSEVKLEQQISESGEAAVVNEKVKEMPAPKLASQPDAATAPEPVKVPDCGSLNKGKKTFTYALPFNAKVTVGFKDNTYRVIAECLGELDASEKKEVGKLIITSLGKYAGRTIDQWDKSKISIEPRYDESDNQTRVFAVIPPDAID